MALVWGKANIPIKTEKAAIQSIMRLLQSWTNFSHNAHKCKPGSPKYEQYRDMLGELCDLTDGDEEKVKDRMRSSKLPTWERDYQFYLNQKAGVMDLMEGVDGHLDKRQKTVTARKEEEERRKELEKERASRSTEEAAREAAAVVDTMEGESGACTALQADVTDVVTADPDAHVSYRQQYNLRKKPDTVMLNLPRKGLAKLVTPSAGRMHMSTNQSFVYATDIIKAGKGKVSDFAISRSTFHAQRKDTEKKLATKLMETFKNDPNVLYIIIHWDGKKVKLLDRSVKEHIALVLQAVRSGRQPQFIGAPCVPNGTGLAMKDAIIQYLNMYDLTGDNKCKLIGMGFDTTSSLRKCILHDIL